MCPINLCCISKYFPKETDSKGVDLLKVAQLIGTKLVANEFVAYKALQTDPAYSNISPRSRLIATYALCGFANIGSLGTQSVLLFFFSLIF